MSYDSVAGFQDYMQTADEDLLKKLEKQIRDYYVAMGYVVGDGTWSYEVHMSSCYKDKKLHVTLYEVPKEKLNYDISIIFSCSVETTKEMFDKALAFFSTTKMLCDTCAFELPTCKNHDVKYGDGEGNDNVIACGAYQERDGKCKNCDGTGWVCENHNDLAFEGLSENSCDCGEAGEPCHKCNALATHENDDENKGGKE